MFNFTLNILITIHEQIPISVYPFPNLELDLYLQEAQQKATNPEQAWVFYRISEPWVKTVKTVKWILWLSDKSSAWLVQDYVQELLAWSFGWAGGDFRTEKVCQWDQSLDEEKSFEDRWG